eukprot:TRINITY_DN4913_c0_g1_i2.p1 TRINITY_DN4913_c0_g1~~TRINITY_DN4913_c0_g1_i2.p1  ORF type:complete len:1180 (-),score=273.51 TRINITY_DN4913_c0_g1_i2:184-3336(-)
MNVRDGIADTEEIESMKRQQLTKLGRAPQIVVLNQDDKDGHILTPETSPRVRPTVVVQKNSTTTSMEESTTSSGDSSHQTSDSTYDSSEVNTNQKSHSRKPSETTKKPASSLFSNMSTGNETSTTTSNITTATTNTSEVRHEHPNTNHLFSRPHQKIRRSLSEDKPSSSVIKNLVKKNSAKKSKPPVMPNTPSHGSSTNKDTTSSPSKTPKKSKFGGGMSTPGGGMLPATPSLWKSKRKSQDSLTSKDKSRRNTVVLGSLNTKGIDFDKLESHDESSKKKHLSDKPEKPTRSNRSQSTSEKTKRSRLHQTDMTGGGSPSHSQPTSPKKDEKSMMGGGDPVLISMFKAQEDRDDLDELLPEIRVLVHSPYEVDIKFLVTIRDKMSDDTECSTFQKQGGFSYLLSHLIHTSDESIQNTILAILRRYLSQKAVFDDLILKDPNSLKILIAVSARTPFMVVKAGIYSMITRFPKIQKEIGLEEFNLAKKIDEAFSFYAYKSQSPQYKPLVQALQFENSPVLTNVIIKLINYLISSEKTVQDRIRVRTIFQSIDLDRVLNSIENSGSNLYNEEIKKYFTLLQQDKDLNVNRSSPRSSKTLPSSSVDYKKSHGSLTNDNNSNMLNLPDKPRRKSASYEYKDGVALNINQSSKQQSSSSMTSSVNSERFSTLTKSLKTKLDNSQTNQVIGNSLVNILENLNSLTIDKSNANRWNQIDRIIKHICQSKVSDFQLQSDIDTLLIHSSSNGAKITANDVEARLTQELQEERKKFKEYNDQVAKQLDRMRKELDDKEDLLIVSDEELQDTKRALQQNKTKLSNFSNKISSLKNEAKSFEDALHAEKIRAESERSRAEAEKSRADMLQNSLELQKKALEDTKLQLERERRQWLESQQSNLAQDENESNQKYQIHTSMSSPDHIQYSRYNSNNNGNINSSSSSISYSQSVNLSSSHPSYEYKKYASNNSSNTNISSSAPSFTNESDKDSIYAFKQPSEEQLNFQQKMEKVKKTIAAIEEGVKRQQQEVEKEKLVFKYKKQNSTHGSNNNNSTSGNDPNNQSPT